MRIGALGFSPFVSFGNLRIKLPVDAVLESRRAADEGPDLVRLAGLLHELRAALARGVERVGEARRGSRSAAIHLRSADALGLVPSDESAVLRSAAEVNALPTSYSPFGPSWAGSSAPIPTLNGVYDGDQGDEQLTFRVTLPGVVGLTPVRVDVFDEGGTRVDRLDYASGYVPGTPVALANGLTLALTGGAAILNDEFGVAVSTSVGSAVDPSKPFDGTRNQRPNFEPGEAVVAGSFTVNGVAIAVGASDSIASVLARIDASAAGVTASFDAASERILLTQRTPGAAGAIVLADDTSGFLSATKLDAAVLEPGSDSDLDRPIAEVGALSGITSGSLLVNGHAVAIDVSSDSLAEVLARIDALPFELSATFDVQQGRVVLGASRQLDLDDGGTSFFARLGIETGVHRKSPGRSRGFSDPASVRKGLQELARAWNDLFGVELGGAASRQATRVRTQLVEAVRAVFSERLGRGEGPVLRSRLGLDFELSGEADTTLTLDDRALERGLREDAAGLSRLLLGEDDEKGGLLAALERAVGSSLPALGVLLESHQLSFLDIEA